MTRYFVLFLFILIPFYASAHSPIASIKPKDGSSLYEPFKKIEIIFRSPVRLIKVTIWKVISIEHRSMFKNLFNAVETQKIYLKNNFINEESTYHSIELPSVGVGAYDVKWRAISQDGHIIKGKFSINVLGK